MDEDALSTGLLTLNACSSVLLPLATMGAVNDRYSGVSFERLVCLGLLSALLPNAPTRRRGAHLLARLTAHAPVSALNLLTPPLLCCLRRAEWTICIGALDALTGETAVLTRLKVGYLLLALSIAEQHFP